MRKVGTFSERGASKLRYLLALLLIPGLVFAQVYQWVDENGNVNFGDKPPSNANAKSLDLPTGPSQAEVDKAQRELQDTLDTRATSDGAAAAPVSATAVQKDGKPIPEFSCYTPIAEVLRGATKAAYSPVTPSDLTQTQTNGARKVLASAAGRWRGSSIELTCAGSIDAPTNENLHFDVNSVATWRDDQGLLILENRARGSKRRTDETRVSYIEVNEGLYFFEAKGGGNQTSSRTIALRGNQAEGLHLDKSSLAFMSKRRSYHVMRTELRHLKVKNNRLEYTELYFHKNILTGARLWTLRR
ncbi:MAG: DUF4124 domain-containing protein [Halioglobus sp.]